MDNQKKSIEIEHAKLDMIAKELLIVNDLKKLGIPLTKTEEEINNIVLTNAKSTLLNPSESSHINFSDIKECEACLTDNYSKRLVLVRVNSSGEIRLKPIAETSFRGSPNNEKDDLQRFDEK